MIKYLSIDKFLELVSEKGVVTDIRKIDKDDIKSLFNEIEQEKTTLEKQIGYIVDNSFKGKIITTGNFTPLKFGDIIIIKNNDEHYISLIEEVV